MSEHVKNFHGDVALRLDECSMVDAPELSKKFLIYKADRLAVQLHGGYTLRPPFSSISKRPL